MRIYKGKYVGSIDSMISSFEKDTDGSFLNG